MAIKGIYELIKNKYPLTFKEDTHQYFLDGQECKSVSKVLESLKKPFNANEQAVKCSQNPNHKLFGNTAEQILAIWAETNKIACEKGHIFHEFAENWIKICFANNEEFEKQTSYIITELYDKNINLHYLFGAFQMFFSKNIWQKGLQIVATEVQIVSPTYKIGGTFDALFMYQGNLFIFDWKTNLVFETQSLYNLLAPYNNFDKSDLTVYTFQVHLYRWILENEYGLEIKGARIIHFDDKGNFTSHQPKFNYDSRFMESVLQRFHNNQQLLAA